MRGVQPLNARRVSSEVELIMSEEPSHNKSLSKNVGMLTGLGNRLKLILRLLGDRRVNPLLKAIPILGALYFLIPDLVLGPLDDAAIIWLATTLFVELCPPAVVDEHMRAIQGLSGEAAVAAQDEIAEEDIIDGEVIDG